MNDIYLLTGGNIGDRLLNLRYAYELIERKVGQVVKKSFVFETEAWGYTNQGRFLNQALRITSALGAEDVLHGLLNIELELGRKRLEKMGPRIIDIDILFFSNQIIYTPDLIVPHPRMADRRFVLTPLNQIAPDFVHPVLNKTISQLLQICPDQLDVKPYNEAS